MRDLTPQECLIISGADDKSGKFTVDLPTALGTAGSYLGGTISPGGAAIGGLLGAAAGNYLSGERAIGSVGPSGIPWGATNGGGVIFGPSQKPSTGN